MQETTAASGQKWLFHMEGVQPTRRTAGSVKTSAIVASRRSQSWAFMFEKQTDFVSYILLWQSSVHSNPTTRR